MRINYALFVDTGTEKWRHVVFGVKTPTSSESEKMELLRQLIMDVRRGGININQAAIAFEVDKNFEFFGSHNLVDYLTKNGVPVWTNSLDLKRDSVSDVSAG